MHTTRKLQKILAHGELVEPTAKNPALARQHAGTTPLELLDDRSVTLLVVERAKLVHTTAELARLHPGADVSAPEGSVGIPDLFTSPGAADGPSPVWWQDLHASANVPRTDHLAEALAHAVARRCRGVVVAPRTAPPHPLIGENP